MSLARREQIYHVPGSPVQYSSDINLADFQIAVPLDGDARSRTFSAKPTNRMSI